MESTWFGEDIAALAGGEEHTLAIRSDGTVVAWGSNAYGRLGIGEDTWSPQAVIWASSDD